MYLNSGLLGWPVLTGSGAFFVIASGEIARFTRDDSGDVARTWSVLAVMGWLHEKKSTASEELRSGVEK